MEIVFIVIAIGTALLDMAAECTEEVVLHSAHTKPLQQQGLFITSITLNQPKIPSDT